MMARFTLFSIVLLATAGLVFGQTAAKKSSRSSRVKWQAAGAADDDQSVVQTSAEQRSNRKTPSQPVVRISHGNGDLPNEHGQVWREYDLSPYTVRVTTTKRPEQAVVDWILSETGYEAWHGEQVALLSATPRTLRVYHTPEMQQVVARLVDRFVFSEAETCTFSLRMVTLAHPNWRAKAQRLLTSVAVQAPGANAWVIQKEDAALLLADLRRRNDYREHSSPHLMVHSGQSTVVSALRTRTYLRDVVPKPNVWPGFEARPGQIDEGFSLEFSPLLSTDRKMIEAMIQCNIDQIEKMVPVMLDVPAIATQRQRTRIEVPQITQFRFREKFRWPVGQVLLVSMGMVALPVPVDAKAKMLVPGIPLLMSNSPPRADLLVFVEAKGNTELDPRVARTPKDQAKSYRGRY